MRRIPARGCIVVHLASQALRVNNRAAWNRLSTCCNSMNRKINWKAEFQCRKSTLCGSCALIQKCLTVACKKQRRKKNAAGSVFALFSLKVADYINSDYRCLCGCMCWDTTMPPLNNTVAWKSTVRYWLSRHCGDALKIIRERGPREEINKTARREKRDFCLHTTDHP